MMTTGHTFRQLAACAAVVLAALLLPLVVSELVPSVVGSHPAWPSLWEALVWRDGEPRPAIVVCVAAVMMNTIVILFRTCVRSGIFSGRMR